MKFSPFLALLLLTGCYTEGTSTYAVSRDPELFWTEQGCDAHARLRTSGGEARYRGYECQQRVVGFAVGQTMYQEGVRLGADGLADPSPAWFLYRTSLNNNRVYVATFDDPGRRDTGYNRSACEHARGLYQDQPNMSENYWCEAE